MKKVLLALCVITVMLVTGCSGDPQPNKVTIMFNTDGGSNVAPIEIDKGGALPAAYFEGGSNAPAKTGYVFKGWTLGDVTVTSANAFDVNATLKAQWAREVRVVFNLGFEAGDGTGSALPDSVTIISGTALGDQFPGDPTRTWTWSGAFEFLGWYNGATRYTSATVINTTAATFILAAQWQDNRIFTQAPDIHPGNHFQETGGRTRNVRVNDEFTVEGLLSNVERGAGVLSSQWYRTTSETDALQFSGEEIDLRQTANADTPHELSLPFRWSEPAAGKYWYWVVVTNTNVNATEARTNTKTTMDRLEVTVTE